MLHYLSDIYNVLYFPAKVKVSGFAVQVIPAIYTGQIYLSSFLFNNKSVILSIIRGAYPCLYSASISAGIRFE